MASKPSNTNNDLNQPVSSLNTNTRKRRRTISTISNNNKSNLNDEIGVKIKLEEVQEEQNQSKKAKISKTKSNTTTVKRRRGRPPKNQASNIITKSNFVNAKNPKIQKLSPNITKQSEKLAESTIEKPTNYHLSEEIKLVATHNDKKEDDLNKIKTSSSEPAINSKSTLISKSTVLIQHSSFDFSSKNDDNDENNRSLQTEIIISKSSKSTNKLIKSLITKSKSSNLQKNKLLSNGSSSSSCGDGQSTCASPTTSSNINSQFDKESSSVQNNEHVNRNLEILIQIDNNNVNNNNNNLNSYSKQNLLNSSNAILFYNNYMSTKLNKLNDDLIKLNEFENTKHDLILNMKSPPLPTLNWANNLDIWKLMHLKDIKYYHDCYCLNKHDGIDSEKRVILLDWLAEISYAYRLHRETFHLSIEYIDRFMTHCKHRMRVDRLQLIGLTSLFLASKVEEIYPPKLKDFATHMENYSHNNEEVIQEFELFMLKTLNWEISPVTANTWLTTYLQIASINLTELISNINDPKNRKLNENENIKIFNTHVVMPLSIYKNSNVNLKDYLKQSNNNNNNKNTANNNNNEINSVHMKFTSAQQNFYLNNYLKSITLIDLCLFDIESLKFNYSILAAAALYHMISLPNKISITNTSNNLCLRNESVDYIIEQCTGYKINELEKCIRWMLPFADTCRVVLTEEKMIQVKQYSNIDPEDCHNIQMYYQFQDLVKVALSRKTPCKFNSNSNNILLTPPGSVQKYNCGRSSTTPS